MTFDDVRARVLTRPGVISASLGDVGRRRALHHAGVRRDDYRTKEVIALTTCPQGRAPEVDGADPMEVES